MRTHLNTLYVQTQGACLGKSGETVRVKVDGQVKLAVPLHHLQGIVCFGRVSVSTSLIAACSAQGVSISFMSEHGRFQARVVPPTAGNVVLRREQYRLADRPEACLVVARSIVAGKIQNSRTLLLRAAREAEAPEKRDSLRKAADRLACALQAAETADSVNTLRGCEGDAARVYFEAFDCMIRQQNDVFFMKQRSRRPPRCA